MELEFLNEILETLKSIEQGTDFIIGIFIGVGLFKIVKVIIDVLTDN